MLTLIFVLTWVLLGLGLLFVALSGGPGGAGERMMSTGRGARRTATVLFVIALLVLGAGVPAAVIAAVSNNDSIPEANVSRSHGVRAARPRPVRPALRELPHAARVGGDRRDRPGPRRAAAQQGARPRRDPEGPRARQRPDGEGPVHGPGRRGRRQLRGEGRRQGRAVALRARISRTLPGGCNAVLGCRRGDCYPRTVPLSSRNQTGSGGPSWLGRIAAGRAGRRSAALRREPDS